MLEKYQLRKYFTVKEAAEYMKLRVQLNTMENKLISHRFGPAHPLPETLRGWVHQYTRNIEDAWYVYDLDLYRMVRFSKYFIVMWIAAILGVLGK